MTVRTWFTLSAVVVIALFGAVALKLTAPVNAPTIVARAGELRLHGRRISACWPNGRGKEKCTGAENTAPDVATLSRRGTLRVVVAYPLQPKQGYIEVRSGDRVVFKRPWSENTDYNVPSGNYELVAYAKYAKSSHLEYAFGFRVR